MRTGHEIRQLRKKIRLSQEGLANLIGVSRSAVYDWERDAYSPEGENLVNLAKALGVSVAYLIGETDDPTPFFECGGEAGQQLGEDAKQPPQPPHTPQIDDVIFVPVVSNKIVTACCGNGSPYAEDVTWEYEGQFPVPANLLMGYTWQGCSYKIMEAEGSSMEPHIQNGDKILFAEGIDLALGDIGVFSLNGRLLIRGLIKKNGTYVLRAHNWKEYSDLEIDIKSSDFYVLGKVLKVVSARNVPPVL